jgi:SAM-dependent methyltransferase
MRDVVTSFYAGVLEKLIADNTISRTDSVLVVCGGPLDEHVMREVGFSDFTITNLTGDFANQRQDAENLTYDECSFDTVIVHAGLHHCRSPHRALLEMYRVARKCAVALESRDSLLMRTAVHFGLTEAHEISSISPDGKSGGVADTGVPNYIYRWTERDVKKTIESYDPGRVPNIKYFYDFRIPIQRFTKNNNHLLRWIGMILEPLSQLVALMAPKQCNEFAFAVSKNGGLHPWVKLPAPVTAKAATETTSQLRFAAAFRRTCGVLRKHGAVVSGYGTFFAITLFFCLVQSAHDGIVKRNRNFDSQRWWYPIYKILVPL